jgi:hypothetical protein
MGFVIDDPYGDFAKRTARTFEVTWPVSVARTLADGVNQFVRLSFPHSSGRPDSLTARAVVRPRFTSFGGASNVYLTAELTPVVVAGEVVYRAKGRTSSAISSIKVRANGAEQPVRTVDATHFEIDLAPDVAFAIAYASDLTVDAQLGSGAATKTAKLGLALKKLSLTAKDPYELYPRPTCDEPLKACLLALPDGALDLASCGEAIVVNSCAGRIGVVADDVAVLAAVAQGQQVTSGTQFRADAKGLVGAARAEQLQGTTEESIDYRATRLYGRWYLSTTARDAELKRAVDSAILSAYTRPLDLVEPTVPVPGNAQAIRNAAADALLAELATYDFVSTEFARSYDTLVAQFRDRHVESIREFRETNAIEPHPSAPKWDVLVGRWLDAYVEVSVVRATGVAVQTFIEID